MTRILASAVIFTLTIAGCDEGGATTGGAPPSRVVAVSASGTERPLAELCDFLPDESSAPNFEFPALADGSAPSPGGGWRWVNLWATWCAPCVEEMPMLMRWSAAFEADGAPVEFVFVSTDTTAEAVEAFRAEHPDAPDTSRMSDASTLPEWTLGVGLDRGAALPLHVLVDPEGRVRCARGGAVTEADYALAARLVSR